MMKKARIKDGPEIQRIINLYAKEGKMLQRPILEIYENIRDFFVLRQGGKISGVAALSICWDDLAELRSVAVIKSRLKKGLGKKLIQRCMKEAKELGIKKVFVLTYIPDYFMKFGFKEVDRAELPHKIWKDCVNCPKFPDCGEVPMVRII